MITLQRLTAIDSRLEAYAGFFDSEWAANFLEIVRNSKLREPGFALVCDWDCASSARALPWVFGKCLQQRIDLDFERYVPLDLRKVRVLGEKLIERLEKKGESVRPMLRKKLLEAIGEIDQEFTEVSKRAKNDVLASRSDLWEELVNEEAFVKSVWASERSAYGAVYYAYECFLRDSVRIAKGNAEYRFRNADEFKDHLKELFGAELTRACWSDQPINTARLARNALVHNGGRVTEQLGKQSHNFRVDDDLIQIGASDTTQLYNLLSRRVQQFARHATTLAQFVRDTD